VSSSGPNAPPLDILGRYEVTWSIAYDPPDTPPNTPYSALRGECSGVIDIRQQTDHSIQGTIVISEGAHSPCRTASFRLHGTMRRVYAAYGNYWDVSVTSDIEPLIGCSYVSEALGEHHPNYRGSGIIDATHLSLGFIGIYRCSTGLWRIGASAYWMGRP
jgi:hypothetical protein